jgi:hypothetical protein
VRSLPRSMRARYLASTSVVSNLGFARYFK